MTRAIGSSSIFSAVQTTQRALDYHLSRHAVLASNVANVDTPGFRPLELVRPESAESGASVVPLAATAGAHLSGAGMSPEGALTLSEEQVVSPGNDGNSVSLERELSKVAANDLRYESAARLVQQQLAALRYAANDGSGG